MSVDVGLEVFASLGEKLDRESKYREERKNIVHQSPIVGQLSGSGTLDEATQLSPTIGNCWSIRRLTVIGFTAGSVTVYLNNLEPVAPYPSPAVFTYGRGELLLQPKDRLVVVATGITGNIQLWGVADEFPHWYLSEYLD